MSDLIAVLNDSSVISLTGFGIVAAAGLLMGVAPSSLPLISVVMGYVASHHEAPRQGRHWQGLLPSTGFILGMATTDAAIGALFGLLGFVVVRALAEYLGTTNLLLGLLLILLALALLRVIRIPWLTFRATPRPARSFGAAFVLGVPFGLAACPACTPMILPILGAAAATGEPWAGAALMFTFGLARGVPILLAGTAAGSLKTVKRLAPLAPRIERAGGLLLLAAALYFLYQAAVYYGLAPPLPFLL